MERIVNIAAAYDKRDPDPRKNYGIHGVDMRFILKGDKGAIQFVLFTNWQLPEVQRELAQRHYAPSRNDPHWMERPMPADIGYHSPFPQYEGQTVCQESCEWLDGKPCYYDGSSLNAENVFEIMLRGGGDALWAELERRYAELFGNADQLVSEASGSVPSAAQK